MKDKPRNGMNFSKEILELKKKKNAIILAHYYQIPEIQELADYVGDSLGLSQKAQRCDADIIVFAGVHFMAETAKILNPLKKVIVPDLNAGCSLAESCMPKAFKKFISKYPGHTVVSYINCSAEIKTMSDWVCTSSNAEKVIKNIAEGEKILFAPDKNLGRYLIKKTGRDMLLWDGACVVHEAFSKEKLTNLYIQYPKAKIIAHPESEDAILSLAHFIGSTAAMLDFVKKDSALRYIVATEAGILHQMHKEVPHKLFIPLPTDQDNSCACSECAYMKINTLEKLYDCLLNESPEILVEEEIINKAIIPIERMLALSN